MAVLVNVRGSWRGATSDAERAWSALGDWYGLADSGLERNADVLLALAPGESGRERVVGVYDIVPNANGERWTRNQKGEVRFNGAPSERFLYLLNYEWPIPVFSIRGMARGARYFPTSQLPDTLSARKTTPSPKVPSVTAFNGLRLWVDDDGVTVIEAPAGAVVKVVSG